MHYKATRPDGMDFRTGTVRYAAALATGELVTHPHSTRMVPGSASTYLSVSTEPAETLIGGEWPARLFRVEPTGGVLDNLSAGRHKRACLSLRVLEELPAWQALGPNGREVERLVQQAATVTAEQVRNLRAAYYSAARVAAYAAGVDATGVAYSAAVWAAAEAARKAVADVIAAEPGGRYSCVAYAALALVVRDVLDPQHFATLTAPWFRAVGDPRDLLAEDPQTLAVPAAEDSNARCDHVSVERRDPAAGITARMP
ncbi:MAG: hypothetical protein ACRDQ7_15650 [Haloechinothrix sp.]